ncbi:FAD-dependent pyridine nucleotide-disulfide oxidoreductase [Penicillium cosmopolitanum]|uniref:FAD-dependent pyridine nucleotide-disulfide oxidoreductase n=1 Tax=Penicillium cosmopolitanum TaxID=1131564 RepID=A0A9W9W013_9EURO|nr:FAD-dependent pyridine nucleotide-disulfide oxidoreductase [Penicillium cosmopolitanum]KAJ5392455.1 FAD-dependent pyridine nucleotide-disulfide oxidoreductase [Penicillium cosmopolitanum]
MQEPTAYNIIPTKLIPNSPKPLLHYKNAFVREGKLDIGLAYDTFVKNGWEIQWVTQYARSMVVVSGPGRIRWGVADLDEDEEKHTYGDAREEGGLLLDVNVGDLFVIPAGVAHKNYDPFTTLPLVNCLTGNARGIESDDPREMVQGLKMKGFMMMGAYPRGENWSWGDGGDSPDFVAVWNVENPEFDPFVGSGGGGWKVLEVITNSGK